MTVLALLTDPTVIEKILRHLGLPSAPAPLAPARCGSWQPAVDPLPPPIQMELGERETDGEASEGTVKGPPERRSRIRLPA